MSRSPARSTGRSSSVGSSRTPPPREDQDDASEYADSNPNKSRNESPVHPPINGTATTSIVAAGEKRKRSPSPVDGGSGPGRKKSLDGSQTSRRRESGEMEEGEENDGKLKDTAAGGSNQVQKEASKTSSERGPGTGGTSTTRSQRGMSFPHSMSSFFFVVRR